MKIFSIIKKNRNGKLRQQWKLGRVRMKRGNFVKKWNYLNWGPLGNFFLKQVICKGIQEFGEMNFFFLDFLQEEMKRNVKNRKKIMPTTIEKKKNFLALSKPRVKHHYYFEIIKLSYSMPMTESIQINFFLNLIIITVSKIVSFLSN